MPFDACRPRAARILALAMLTTACSLGCAQVVALRQAPPLDRRVLHQGAERDVIVATLGFPLAQDRPPGADRPLLRETYVYTDGGSMNSPGGKAARIALYTVGDLMTAFLTQILWIPAELLFDGTRYHARVDYYRRPLDQVWVAESFLERRLEE